VIYLLDVNVLLALNYMEHPLHKRADMWLAALRDTEPTARPATCSITELGFVRVASGAAGLARDVSVAKHDLRRLKERRLLTLLEDGLDANRLPEWVNKSKQVTDGHLLTLARVHQGVLATLDAGIPGALLIPDEAADSLFVREPRPLYGIAA
jgi:predicted nucleic acid-binding protein